MAAPEPAAFSDAARMTRPRLPRRLYDIDPWWTAAFLGGALGAFVGFGLLASWEAASGGALWLRFVVVAACVLAAAQGAHLLGFVGHEGIHVMLHRNKWVSTLLGAFVSAMTAFPAVGYGIAHWNHHRYTNQAGDPDAAIYPQFRGFWSRFLLARGAGTRTHLKNLVTMAVGRPLPLGYRLPFTTREQQVLAVLNLAFLLFWISAYGTLAYLRPRTALFAVALPLAALVPLSGLRGYLEHAGTGLGMFRDSRSYTHPVYTALFFGNNYHLEHHIYPGVPCYHLSKVHRLLAADGYFARWGSAIDATLVGPLLATTRRAQYPEPTASDLGHDPFPRVVSDETDVPRLPLEPRTASGQAAKDDGPGLERQAQARDR